MSVFAILLFVSSWACMKCASRDASTGWNTQSYYAAPAMSVESPNQVAEGFTYQQSTGKVLLSNVLPSSNTTAVYFSTAINGQVVTYTSTSTQNEFLSSSTYGTFGMVADPNDDSIIWAAVGLYPPTSTSACAIQSASTNTDTVTNLYDFSSVKNAELGCLVNDVAVQSSAGESVAVYATDLVGYRVYKLDLLTGNRTVLNNDTSLLCSSYPSGCDGTDTDGPDGIVLYTDTEGRDWLIVGVSPNRLVKMDPVSGNASVVHPGPNTPPGALQKLDGMSLYLPSSSATPRSAVLYGAGSTSPNGTIEVLTSVDDWATYEVRSVYNASCGDASDTAVRLAGDYAMVLCNNNFMPGSILVNLVADVDDSNPIASTAEHVVYTNMLPESFDYDSNRNMLVFGSQSTGAIRGFPYNNQDDAVITYPSSAAHTYISSGTDGIYATSGVQVNPHNVFENDCYALVCMGSAFAPSSNSAVQTGLYLIDLCSDTVVSSVYLPVSTTAPASFANDVTVLDGVAYVSDFSGNQMWAVSVNNLQLSNPRTVLTSTSCAINDASFCVANPNGVETVNGYIVFSNFNSGLAKYVPSTGVLYKVNDPTGIVFGFDGITFSDDGMILYGARNSFFQSYQSVLAMTSCNDWENVTLLYSFQLDCNDTNAPANQLITNTDGTQDLVILCNYAFGSGPYTIQRVRNVNNVVANQALSLTSCASVVDDDDVDNSSNGNTLSDGAIVGVTLVVLLLAFGIYCLVAFFVSQEDFYTVIASLTTDNSGLRH